jgi:hypothetical protein
VNDPTGATHANPRPKPSGLPFAGLLVGAVLASALLGQLEGPDSSRAPSRAVAPTVAPTVDATVDPGTVSAFGLPTAVDFATGPDLAMTPQPDKPIGSLTQCPVRSGGLVLTRQPPVTGWSFELWDCHASKGPWSVVIRGHDGQLGVHGAVVTFPVDRARTGAAVNEPSGGRWNPGTRVLVWPLAGSHAQIVGDVGQATLTDLAMRITVEGGKPHLAALDGFSAAAAIPYRPAIVHEMRYSTVDLGLLRALGSGLVYTGTMTGASFENQAFKARAQQAGQVHGRPAIYARIQNGIGTLAWEPTPGEVDYIGFTGSSTQDSAIQGASIPAQALEVLRALADGGRALTAAQWQSKDRSQIRSPSG